MPVEVAVAQDHRVDIHRRPDILIGRIAGGGGGAGGIPLFEYLPRLTVIKRLIVLVDATAQRVVQIFADRDITGVSDLHQLAPGVVDELLAFLIAGHLTVGRVGRGRRVGDRGDAVLHIVRARLRHTGLIRHAVPVAQRIKIPVLRARGAAGQSILGAVERAAAEFAEAVQVVVTGGGAIVIQLALGRVD